MRMDAESIAMLNKEIQTREKSKIVIPDNATNLDVLLSVFPDITVDVKYPLLWHYNKDRKKNEMLCDMFDWDWLYEKYDGTN